MKKLLLKILVGIGVLMVSGALLGLSYLGDPLADGEAIDIQVPGDDTLAGTYFPGNGEAGVLLLEGFGSDQTALRPLAAEFADQGLDVLSFDFSGHGRSPGGLDFDNAATDRMAKQVLAAYDTFQEASGLSPDQIIFLGHSLGARVGLQASTMTDAPPKALVLLGTQVNLAANQQAEFFTGTSDADLGWVQALGPDNPDTDIFLISGTWDDILTPEAAGLLVEKLAGETLDAYSFQAARDPDRVIVLTEGILHNYEIYSAKGRIDALLTTSLGQAVTFRNMLGPYVLLWLLGNAGLFLVLISGSGLVEISPSEASTAATVGRLGWFIGGKLLLWVPALIPGALIGGLVFFAPLGTPAFNLYYIAFFGGYGVLLWFLYLKGKMPGVQGKIILKGNPGVGVQKSYLAGFIFLLVLLAVSLMARSGWWYTFPFNHRFIWLIVFTLINSVSFVIGFREIEMLRTSFPEKGWLVWVNALVGLFPFFLYAGFLGALGSLSGLVGNVQGLVILALAIAAGSLVYKVSQRPWLAALLQAFLLYWLILPQGVLFR